MSIAKLVTTSKPDVQLTLSNREAETLLIILNNVAGNRHGRIVDVIAMRDSLSSVGMTHGPSNSFRQGSITFND